MVEIKSQCMNMLLQFFFRNQTIMQLASSALFIESYLYNIEKSRMLLMAMVAMELNN
jgi:hypothetical protein